ncbi:MAG: GAF domain-containing sensor histidine kinase [Candidatus Omnitrophota bacterium]|nr:GAF domain-containing sensor histidine kinase [Candidatus Omnitrophota bacterium]
MNRIVENIRGRLINSPVRRYYKLKASYSIAVELLSALDLEDALKILVNRIASYMSVEIVSIMLTDNDKKRLVVKIAKGLDEKIVNDASIEIGKGVSGWVGKTGQSLLIKDITKDPRFALKASGKYYNNSLLSVPLKMRGRIIGVVNVNNKASKDVFRESDLDLLNAIADFAAIAIEVIKLEEQISKSNKDHRELVSNVAHDLKTPLATIKEAILLMLEGVSGQINEKQKKYLDISAENVERMVHMVDDILLSDDTLCSRQSLNRNLFNVTDTAKGIIDSLGIIAKKKGIKLGGYIPDKRIEIWGDPDKLNEVISNLVENAIKYNRPEGRVDVSLEEDERSVTISVRDTGMGISKEDIGKIFDRYYRINSAERKDVAGSGLGLSIVKNIVNMHKGNIAVESESDHGTKFTVTLPKDLRTLR